MPGKPQWLSVAILTEDNTREHGLMLNMYIDTTIAFMDEGHKPPPDTLKSLFQATLTFITTIKKELNIRTILDEIWKAADECFRSESYIEEQIIAIQNAPAMTGKASYATIASQGATEAGTSSLLPTSAPFLNSYSKANEIIIKLNDKSEARALDSQSSKDIVESIYQYVKTKNITDTDIRAARKLKSSDIVVYTANDGETKKLLHNDCWTEVLGRKPKPITRTFRVVAHAVRVDSIDLAHKEITIEKKRAKNAASIPGLEIKWIGWLTNLFQGKKKSSLVVECETAIQASEAIDEGLAIGAELHGCTLYNAACKQKQCFKF